ncbi:hypothetical protein E2562_013401 [Oryza meyeriana var. granulata]|uniref:Uncharacterized protein n=1 Tax=Oryza meyeriana var. granulata TaxID=110450 RepID=A0A6G1ECK1_9ORYZ|nr:hypothetical protein E2562_013401 [Oryza meyeriana var. granulata]
MAAPPRAGAQDLAMGSSPPPPAMALDLAMGLQEGRSRRSLLPMARSGGSLLWREAKSSIPKGRRHMAAVVHSPAVADIELLATTIVDLPVATAMHLELHTDMVLELLPLTTTIELTLAMPLSYRPWPLSSSLPRPWSEDWCCRERGERALAWRQREGSGDRRGGREERHLEGSTSAAMEAWWQQEEEQKKKRRGKRKENKRE